MPLTPTLHSCLLVKTFKDRYNILCKTQQRSRAGKAVLVSSLQMAARLCAHVGHTGAQGTSEAIGHQYLLHRGSGILYKKLEDQHLLKLLRSGSKQELHSSSTVSAQHGLI